MAIATFIYVFLDQIFSDSPQPSDISLIVCLDDIENGIDRGFLPAVVSIVFRICLRFILAERMVQNESMLNVCVLAG